MSAQQKKSLSVVVNAPLTGSVGSPTVDRQVAQLVRPLRVVVEEVHALKEMGKDPISKDENAVRRLLNTLHRVFTMGAMGNNYGSFWEFLVAAEEQIVRQQGSAFDRFARDLTNAKERVGAATDRVTGRGRVSSQGPAGANNSKDSPSADDSGSPNPTSSTNFNFNANASSTNAFGFPLPTPAQERALARSVEHVRSFNILNKLSCLHYWLITALQQGGVLSAALTCAVVPMRDVLQGYMGPDSPFYAQQSAMAMAEASVGDGVTATLCWPFLNELLKVFEELGHHPDMGPIRYNLDITCMQLYQTVTDRNGNVIVGVSGASNTEPLEYFVPNALHTAYSSGGRGGRRRRRGGRGGRARTATKGTNTEEALLLAAGVCPSSPKFMPIAGSPLRSSEAFAAATAAAAAASAAIGGNQQLMSEQAALLAFNGPPRPPHESDHLAAPSAGGKKSVMTFAELCSMQNALLEEKNELRSKEESLAAREKDVLAREAEAADASAEVLDVLLKLKDLYIRHVVGLRERQEMGLRITAKDIDRKIPQLLGVLDHGDFDMVADEDELNAAGQLRSQRHFSAGGGGGTPRDTSSSAAPSPGASVSNRGRASSMAFGSPGLGTKPLVIVDPESGIPPAKVAGLIALRLTEVPEKDRKEQLRQQNFMCADCGASFGGEGSNNVLISKLKKTSEILTMQKPRRCHYCTQLLCHTCHSNQSALMPFRVFPKWDFSAKHACKRCHTFLQQNYALAHYDIRKMPREVSSTAVLQQCAAVRKFLMRAALIIAGCTRPSSASFAQDLHTHYFQREFFYSMADLNVLHTTERRESNPANIVHIVPGVSNVVGAVQWVAGVNIDNLTERLSAKLAQCKQHIRIECANCKQRASMPCSICNVTTPVFVVDEDGTQCESCHTIYHAKCLEAKGCPACGKADGK